MIRIFFTILFATFIFNYTLSQNLPNYDFEDWVTNDSFENPDGWSTSNFSVFSVVTFNTVTKETLDKYSGESCMKLKTTEKNVSGEIVKVVGLTTLGTFDINIATRQAQVTGGVGINTKPSIFSGYYKYSTPGIDSCIMSIFITKYSNERNTRDTLGIGVFTSSNQSEWTLFEAPVTYYSNETPDSMNIVILSSDTSIFEPESTLLIDNLYIDGTVGLESIILENSFKLYPNPTTEFLTIETGVNKNTDIYVFNALGALVKKLNVSNKQVIDVTDLKQGIYFLTLHLENDKITKTFYIQ